LLPEFVQDIIAQKNKVATKIFLIAFVFIDY
jgi:hypothetical protein